MRNFWRANRRILIFDNYLMKFVLKQFSSDSAALAEYAFDGGLLSIGSSDDSTIVVRGSAPEQAVVILEGEQLTLINSGEGTVLNGRNLRREAMEPLQSGDEIRIGDYIISVGGENGSGNFTNRESIEIVPNQTVNLPENAVVKTENQTRSVEPNEAASKKPNRNFADVLNALRTEEDSFYFIVENGSANEETRVPIEQAEMPIGLNASGQITCAVNEIAALYAIVRKDWSGIVVEAQRGNAVFVNDEPIKTVVRLRNGDFVTFNTARKSKQTQSLKLHEPSSLVALESILETRSRTENLYRNPGGAGNFSSIHTTETNAAVAPTIPIVERDFFGYFSFFEVVTMAIGTLIAAVLIFLLLEFTV